MVTRWGVLYSVEQILDRRYSGKVFVRSGASGHMFNQHYMDPMFPLGKGAKGPGFLDQVVDVDEGTASRREGEAVRSARRGRVASGLEPLAFGNGETVPVGLIVGGEREFNYVERGTSGAVAARGKTVRELSRLWRYVRSVGGGCGGRARRGLRTLV